MSDPITNPPLDSGSPTDSTSTNPNVTDSNNTDPNATNPVPTDPTSTDSTSTDPTDPNAGTTTDPNSGTTTDPNAGNASDPNTGEPTADPNGGVDQNGGDLGNVGGTDPSAGSVGQTQTTGSAPFLPSAIPTASGQPSANPNAISGSDHRHNDANSAGFDSQSNNYRKAIIIASGVSGAVGVILVVIVILVVYRRRNRRRDGGGGGATFVNAVPKPPRPASDATWIGQRIAPAVSFNEDKLESGDRASKADSVDSDTTLADMAVSRAKYGTYSTPTHTPRPSVDKLKIADEPLVPKDPFEAPRMSIVSVSRRSLEQQAPQGLPIPRPRKAAPGLRVTSIGSFVNDVVVEQGNGQPSPDLPLITPIEPPAGWRAQLDDYAVDDFAFVPPPARRDSMASLSRQSSRASSRNSRNLDETVSPRKKAVFSVISKKRRSRADSIDPFRKSAASMVTRRKSARTSRAEGAMGFVRRKSGRSSRAESVATPTTPGGRGRSRASSIGRPTTPAGRSRTPSAGPPPTPRRRSQATVNQAQIFSTPIAPPPVLPGLPKTPRTPTTARQSRIVGTPVAFGPRTPRTSSVPPVPQTPRTAPLDREARTPMTAQLRTPSVAYESRADGVRPRIPRAALPRTPISLEDAHWEPVPLPEPPLPTRSTSASATTPRPLPATPVRPRTPKTPRSARAELSLSQVSRALSEVSGESLV
ncbi:hypothetical protein BD311DRAFT_163414 [Dichomitus squalens]|uniref:Uncharacterized protein n=1 Tax=Dichomitus squalens TaxID=114155 RepID=A0A4Q9MT10_9APHY|nr:hypothetical protein BD311DRAFT_163414 [Dichomitus squalens]